MPLVLTSCADYPRTLDFKLRPHFAATLHEAAHVRERWLEGERGARCAIRDEQMDRCMGEALQPITRGF